MAVYLTDGRNASIPVCEYFHWCIIELIVITGFCINTVHLSLPKVQRDGFTTCLLLPETDEFIYMYVEEFTWACHSAAHRRNCSNKSAVCGEAKASNTIIGNRVMMNLYASVTSCVIHAFVHIPERVSPAQFIQHCMES